MLGIFKKKPEMANLDKPFEYGTVRIHFGITREDTHYLNVNFHENDIPEISQLGGDFRYLRPVRIGTSVIMFYPESERINGASFKLSNRNGANGTATLRIQSAGAYDLFDQLTAKTESDNVLCPLHILPPHSVAGWPVMYIDAAEAEAEVNE